MLAGINRIMKNLGYRKCLKLYELLEIGCQIYRSRVTPRNKKSQNSACRRNT
ncbi:hypothetical protein SBF1_7410001 [Candidatus Desulfosporosinus infrequens]|uniref:Uncharacterized protein n=1 Tax=Candidatus Desulfosporosinus infrequens TaxID=2043169 RepID=A0A2U3LQR6_9FIRM|nr:hypothetical protein SBF1_7410001 [Candidatus Desulfosporosinus infrequens]